MTALARSLYPLLLAGVDLTVGSVLYRQVSTGLGLALTVVGVVLLCSVVVQTVSDRRPALRRRLVRSVRDRRLSSSVGGSRQEP